MHDSSRIIKIIIVATTNERFFFFFKAHVWHVCVCMYVCVLYFLYFLKHTSVCMCVFACMYACVYACV